MKQKKAFASGGLFVFVGEQGIEPWPLGPKPSTLPLCYTPIGIFYETLITMCAHQDSNPERLIRSQE